MLCYHTFDSRKKTPYTVSSADFDHQLKFLQAQHIPVIALPDLIAFLKDGKAIPERAVVITIDDGYKSARTIAWPLLQKYGFPFTLFIYPGAIGRHGNALTWDDVRFLMASGADIESHSETHPLLTHPGKVMTHEAYVHWLDDELQVSKAKIEKELGRPVVSIAYPYGGYDEQVIARTKNAGYGAGLTCDDGNVGKETDLLHINRRLIYRTTPLKTFIEGLTEDPLWVTGQSPRDGQRLNASEVQEITAQVKNIGEVIPSSAQLVIDKLGSKPQPIDLSPISGVLKYRLQTPLGHGYYFATLKMQDKLHPNLWREASWLFIIRGIASKNKPVVKVD